MLSFVPVEVKLINLLTFKNLQLCRNLLFPLKKNRLVVMLCRLILSILWMVRPNEKELGKVIIFGGHQNVR
jgi:hypothetical protein